MLWKGCLVFKIYIPSIRRRYGIKLPMVCESDTGLVLLYTQGHLLFNKSQQKNFPSKVVLPLLCDFYNEGYCVTLDNCYPSPEISKELISLGTDCYGNLRKKQDLPSEYVE